MRGGDSPSFFAEAADRLGAILPHAGRVTLPGLDHIGRDDAGNPEQVAEELLGFFAAVL